MYEIFEKLLKQHDVTPYKVSKDTGVTQTLLSNWKNGISTPKTENLQKIADYFNVSLEFLLTGKHSLRKGRFQLPFARNLSKYRQQRGLTIEDLADMTSFSVEDIKDLESGFLLPDDDTITTFAQALEMPEDMLDENDFVKRSLEEVRLLEVIEQRNTFLNLKDKLSTFNILLSESDTMQLEDYEISQFDQLMQASRDKILGELTDLSNEQLFDIYEYHLNKKLLEISSEIKSQL